MITIGVDPHKHLHVALAVNEAGHEVAEWQGPNNPDGWTKLVAWSRSLGTGGKWGIEGARSYARGLAQKLVASGEPSSTSILAGPLSAAVAPATRAKLTNGMQRPSPPSSTSWALGRAYTQRPSGDRHRHDEGSL